MNNCIICKSTNISIIYNGYLRTGSFGKYTCDNHNVFSCKECSTKFITDVLSHDYYTSPEYRQDYNDTTNIENFYSEYDENDTIKISKIGLNNLRNKIICDFGAAAGTFLQSVNNISKYTIAVEPTEYFHNTLKEYNKHVFSYADQLVKSNLKIDVATSFDVIEHVPSPIDYLKNIYDSLEIGGKLYLKTPNFNDILHELLPEGFDPFNYRTAHLFYFDYKSMEYILKKAGFENFTLSYLHDYDISNLLYWMKEQRPTGIGKTEIFSKGFNLIYKNYLEQIGKASSIWITATKEK